MIRRLLLLAPLALFAAGCVTQDEEAERAMRELSVGQNAYALEWSENLATDSHYTRRLGEVEAGRVNLIAGNTGKAEQWFRTAIDKAIDRKEGAPKIDFGDLGNLALASTITDDRTREYYLSAYEINLALEYGILTEELNGHREDALADARLAVYVMDSLADTYGADVAKEEQESGKGAQSVFSSGSYRTDAASMEAAMRATRNSWENPVLWWLTGVLLESNGEKDTALQSYRKAQSLRPDNAFFKSDAESCAARVSPKPGKAKLALIIGEELVPQREAFKAIVPIYTAMSIDLPIYRVHPYLPRPMTVAVGSRVPTAAVPTLDVQALACRDLKEHLPGIIARNISRALVQAGAQAAVNTSNANEYVQLGVFAANLVVSAMRSADTRSWVSLPRGEQIWEADDLEPGRQTVEVRAGNRVIPVTVDLKAGETRLMYVSLF